jgi:hypothetical protein
VTLIRDSNSAISAKAKICAMALSGSNDFGSSETCNDESPCTTSSDDLFADINWPEDEADSPFGEDQFPNAMSKDRDNESPKVS